MKLLLCLLLVSTVYARPGKIVGTVLNEEGQPLLGAAVQILETKQGAPVFNLDGSFVILGVVPGMYTVRVSSLGYKTQTFVAVEVDEDTADEIFAVLEAEKIERDHHGPHHRYVKLDETYRVRRMTQAELQRLPGW